MAAVLAHPEHGYYMAGDPLGRGGDFVTAPEVSQMFGELIGLWCAHVWTQMGRPEVVHLVELGPGRGTLMADAVRAATGVAGFMDAAEVHMVEISPSLEKRQHSNLSNLVKPATWHRQFSEAPSGPLLVVANEFMDVLPVRQFVRRSDGWAERCVTFDDGGNLAWTDGPADAPADLPDASSGEIVEVSPARSVIAAEITSTIAAYGGGALILDYGYGESGPGDTLQAIKGHQFHDVLANPGEADVTAHVDFAAIVRACQEVSGEIRVSGPVPQAVFLRTLGIEARALRLRQGSTRRQMEEVLEGLKRLIAPEKMGTLFKVLGLTAGNQPPPEGFP